MTCQPSVEVECQCQQQSNEQYGGCYCQRHSCKHTAETLSSGQMLYYFVVDDINSIRNCCC